MDDWGEINENDWGNKIAKFDVKPTKIKPTNEKRKEKPKTEKVETAKTDQMTKRVVEKKNEKPNRAVDRKPKVEKRNRKRKKNNPQEDAEKATGKKQKIVEIIEKSPQSR